MANGLRPFALPRPMPQGVSYVQISVVYIRNIIPIRAPVGLSHVQSKPLPGRAWTPHPPARPGLFHPTSGKKNSRKFAVASIRRRRGVRASGCGYAGVLSTIVDTLAASVARNRDKRAQVVAFQLPENLGPVLLLSPHEPLPTCSQMALTIPVRTPLLDDSQALVKRLIGRW
jgi:hypothetical protein